MQRGEVYWVRLNLTEGSEQAGTRPAVILSRDAINHSSPVVVICPLTTHYATDQSSVADYPRCLGHRPPCGTSGRWRRLPIS